MIKFSIILRAYNAEKQLERSVESILQQEHTYWELIIVNDGSQDNTGVLCDQYAKQDSRIRVIHQDNKGCLQATQEGIKIAKGDYICVLDADDWYEREYLITVEKILNEKKVDMVVVNYRIVKSNGEKIVFYPIKDSMELDSVDAILEFLKTTNYALWNKIIRRDLIKYTDDENEYFLHYGKMTNFGEDLYQLMPVLCNCNKIFFTPECLYNYILDDTSISHQKVVRYEQELIKRNRLMQFTYEAIDSRQSMNEAIKNKLRLNTIVILLPIIKKMLKSGKINKNELVELRKSNYYNTVVRTTKFFDIKNRVGIKSAVAFWIFNKIIFILR